MMENMTNDNLNDVIQKYIDKGFGSMTKNDFEVWIFSYLMQHKFQHKTNYDISRELKIPESKVKRLRYEADLKYGENDDDTNYGRIIEFLKNARFKQSGTAIQFTIEDVALRKYFDSVLKKGNRFSDSSFNSEIVSIDFEDLKYFLFTYKDHKQELDDILNKARVKYNDKGITWNGLLKNFANAAAKEAGKMCFNLTINGILNWLSSL